MSRPGPGLTSTSPDRRQLKRSHPQTVGLIGPRLSRTADQRPSGAEPSADGVGRSTAAGTSSTGEEQQPRARTQNAPSSSRSKAAAGENRTRLSSLDPSPAARRAARHAERANPSATLNWGQILKVTFNPRRPTGGAISSPPPLVFPRYLLNECRYHHQTCSTLSPNNFTHCIKILKSRVSYFGHK